MLQVVSADVRKFDEIKVENENIGIETLDLLFSPMDSLFETCRYHCIKDKNKSCVTY
jgi:hypothetical protein